MSNKKEKYFVFQRLVDGVQTEIGRKVKGPGRPPVGPNIMKADDGNIYITGVRQTEPSDPSLYVEVETDEGDVIWYEKTQPASKSVVKKYELVDGKLVDRGAAGRGRPAKGYVKITTDTVVDGVNLNGHFYNDGCEVTTTRVVSGSEVEDEYEEVVDEVEVDEVDDLEAQAMADAAADFAADGGEFEEVEFEEEEETV